MSFPLRSNIAAALLTFVALLGARLIAAESDAATNLLDIRGTHGPNVTHPPLRPDPEPSKRPLAKGPAKFVDAQRGSNENPGTKEAPFRTLQYAITRLVPGDTLYLRGGVYFENVYLAVAGKPDAPITIRSYPGELAVLDGSIPEFQQSPAELWEPFTAGGTGEYRSKKSYPNLRDVVCCFGDSMVGVQTYWHTMDLRGPESGLTEPREGQDIGPLYCGPGVYYDRHTGHLHARLAHTKLIGYPNYTGETDPRKTPLIIAPFRSTPLTIDRTEHVKLQDLLIRGGGYETVIITKAVDLDLDNVVIRGGTYCLRTNNTRQFRFHRSALYGNAPPWSFRGDGSLRDRPGRGLRDIARLTCHAVWTTDTGREFSVYALPANDDWEVSYSEFTDSHDGPYLGGISMRFHHNLIEGFQDDGIYLSQMYPRHLYEGSGAKIEIYQNYFTRSLTAIAFGGQEDTRDEIFIYRNIFDMRGPLVYGRPSVKRPELPPSTGRILGDHGGPPWPTMNFYHNTFVMAGSGARAMGLLSSIREGHPRDVRNNIFFSFSPLSAYPNPDPALGYTADGNLYWSPGTPTAKSDAYFTKYRASALFTTSQKAYPPGFSTNSLAADPLLVNAELKSTEVNDYRLTKPSPAVNAGVPLPAGWPDPLAGKDAGRPDLGALPLGAEPLTVGRGAK